MAARRVVAQRVAAALLAMGAVAAGCGSSGPAAPAGGEVRLCAEVTDDFRCRMPSKTVAPGLPYAFLVEGGAFPSRDVVVQLVRLDAGRPTTIARQRDRVAPDANVYANSISVAQPGIYRLEIWSGRDVFAAVQFEATRGGSRQAGATSGSSGAAGGSTPSRSRVEVRCATECEGVTSELARLHEHCVNDPLGEVRQVMSGRMVALGCCGWASGAYERSCALAGPMRECSDAWTTRCTGGAR